MSRELDYFEYANDTDAQAAYVSSDTADGTVDITPVMTSNTTPSPYAVSASTEEGTLVAYKAFDNTTSYWIGNGGGSDWLKFDFGSGNAQIITKYTLRMNTVPEPTRAPKDWTFEGSNDGSTWTTLQTVIGETSWGSGERRTFTFSNTTFYRYYRINITANNGDATYTQIEDMEMMCPSLQCYSESSIKQQGTYSMKIVASPTDSLNDTLTKTLTTPIDLTGITTIRFNIRASRTGQNITITITDSGGVSTSKAVTISSADTWQTEEWDISAVADADKDAINKIIIKINDANAFDGGIYVDNMYGLFVKTLTETVTLYDLLYKTPTKVLSEVITVADSIIRGFYRILSETVTLIDSVLKQVGRSLSETITLVDSFASKITGKVFSEVVTIADSIIRSSQRVLSEVITIVDSTVAAYGRTLEEVISIVDTFARTVTFQRVLSETITLVDTLIKGAGKILSETVTVVDTFRGNVYKTLTETITLVDSIVRSIGRTITETVTIAETLSSIKKVVRSYTETITIVDSITKARTRLKTLTESISIGDLVKRRLNGLLSIWTKIAKTATDAWSKVAKPDTDSWTKTPKEDL